jgi:hypothetical protein
LWRAPEKHFYDAEKFWACNCRGLIANTLRAQAIACMRKTTGDVPIMSCLIERKSRIIFVTASSVRADDKLRDIVIESRPEFAIVRLSGSKQQFPLSWEKIYDVARQHHEQNLRIEATAKESFARKQLKRLKKAS